MKRIASMICCTLFVLLFLLPEDKARAATAWQEGEVLSGTIQENEIPTAAITLEQDSNVTFTLKDYPMDDPWYNFTDYLVKIYTADREVAASVSTLWLDGDRQKTVLPVNLKKGTYTVEITPDGNLIKGDYAISYTKGAVGMDIEPNNTLAAANPYKIGNTAVGYVNPQNSKDMEDEDYYKVVVPSFGKLNIGYKDVPGAPSNNIATKLEILDQNQNVLYDIKGFLKPGKKAEVLLDAGTYYFRVKVTGVGLFTAYYSFTSEFKPLEKNEWESGRNTSFETADVLVNNKTIKGYWNESDLAYTQVNDYYKFTLATDADVAFTVDSPDTESSIIFSDEKGHQLPINGSGYGESNPYTFKMRLKAGTYYATHLPRYGGLDGYAGYTFKMQIQSFTDVRPANPYYGPIEALAQQGVNKGYADGTFRPAQAIQRKHIFSLMRRMEGLSLPKVRQMKTFKDLPASHPNYEDIKAFYEAGIIDGNGSYMNPEANLTRAELSKILVNTFNLKMKSSPPEFSDVSKKSSLYPYIQVLASNQITVGSNGKFLPNDSVSRQHFSVFLYRLIEQAAAEKP